MDIYTATTTTSTDVTILIMQPATASSPGILVTGSQHIGGLLGQPWGRCDNPRDGAWESDSMHDETSI